MIHRPAMAQQRHPPQSHAGLLALALGRVIRLSGHIGASFAG